MKALIIDVPWIGKILAGSKTWEMRKTACLQTGTIALIRKGSGQVVGVATISGSLPAIANATDYAAAESKHGIPPDRQGKAFADGWRTPWVISHARTLATPVPYDHPSGAVIWVNLSEPVVSAIRAQTGLGNVQSVAQHSTADESPNVMATRLPPVGPRVDPEGGIGSEAAPPISDGSVRLITLTQGNINNGHIYLPLDMFPPDAIGGNKKSSAAARNLTIRFRPGQVVSTDIDRSKRILRNRAATRDVLERAGLKAGDQVRVIRTAPYSYDIASGLHGD